MHAKHSEHGEAGCDDSMGSKAEGKAAACPDRWIDHSSVDIGPDLVADMKNVAEPVNNAYDSTGLHFYRLTAGIRLSKGSKPGVDTANMFLSCEEFRCKNCFLQSRSEDTSNEVQSDARHRDAKLLQQIERVFITQLRDNLGPVNCCDKPP